MISKKCSAANRRTLEALHSVQLREQLVDDTVGDARGVVAPLWRYRVELVEEQHARRRRRRPPAAGQNVLLGIPLDVFGLQNAAQTAHPQHLHTAVLCLQYAEVNIALMQQAECL